MTLLQAAPAALDSIKGLAQEMGLSKNMPVDDFIDTIIKKLGHFAINLAIAVLVFYVGKMLINWIHRVMKKVFVRRKVDASLATFVLSMVKIVLYFMLIVIIIGILGIETSSFIALFASAGVAIGMALSGTLQNFAGGVLILLLKPYKVGDYIEAQGFSGTVREIQIFSTIITTPDNKSILIPNGALSTGSITNWSREQYRRVDWTVSISYGDDVERASAVILAILNSDPAILGRDNAEEKAEEKVLEGNAAIESQEEMLLHGVKAVDLTPVVVLESLGASSVDLKVRAWVKSADYWAVFYRINARIYRELPDAAGCSFPFPQMDVHVVKE